MARRERPVGRAYKPYLSRRGVEDGATEPSGRFLARTRAAEYLLVLVLLLASVACLLFLLTTAADAVALQVDTLFRTLLALITGGGGGGGARGTRLLSCQRLRRNVKARWFLPPWSLSR